MRADHDASPENGILVALLAQLVRADFVARPNLCVTEAQARQLWSLDSHTCRAVLGALCDEGFLAKTSAGLFRRRAARLV